MATETIRDTQTTQLVVFSLGDEQYALPIERVQEIIRYTAPRSVTSGDPSVRGVISLRGKIIPVCDLSSRLGHRDGGEHTENIIIVETADQPVGLMVDGVNEVTTVARDSVDPLPTDTGDLVEGIVELDGRLVILLDADSTTHA